MSHMTVRRAISELINEGVIYSVPGKGIYVAEPKQDTDAGPLTSFHEDMLRRGMSANSRILDSDVITASTALSQIVGLKPGAPLVFLRRLLVANDTPMCIANTYLPHDMCPGILDEPLIDGSLYATLAARYGLYLGTAQRTAEAVTADLEQAELLGVQLPAALLLVEQLTFLEDGRVIEYSRLLYRGDRYRVPVK
jgi:GntR family transcriptional regulator